jgi:VanZ family protein
MFAHSKFYLPAFIWAIIILYLSATAVPKLKIDFLLFDPDKVNHFAAYGLLSVLMGWGIWKTEKVLKLKVLLIILIISSTYGVLMEIMQYLFFPNRYFDYGDMIANILGSIIGIFIIRIYYLFYIK